MQLTPAQIAEKLKTDFDYLVLTIIKNNPTAVYKNLTALGFEVNNVQDAFQSIQQFAANGLDEKVKQALNVDYIYRPDNDELTEAIQILAAERNERAVPPEIWLGIIGAVSALVPMIGQSKGPGQTSTTIQQQSAANQAAALAVEKQKRTLVIVGAVVAVVLVGIIMYVLFKRN
jgi:hypothetical protein